MFSAFLDAFTSVDWDLSEQVVSLSKYAHICFELFHSHPVNFMPNQLYIDSQTCVKNVIFCIAKQKILDDSKPFYLFMTGDDRLENLFGLIWMLGGHNPNCTFKQLVDRAGASIDINDVYSRNPNWDKGHRRLKITCIKQLDHLKIESWCGLATVKSVDLYDAWMSGKIAALTWLRRINLMDDFETLFKVPQTDLMRPFGNGHYPGVADDTEPDRSALIEAPEPALNILSGVNLTCWEDTDSVTASVVLQDGQSDIQQYEDAFVLDDHGLSEFTVSNMSAEDDEEVNLDDVMDLPTELQLPTPVNMNGEKPSPWLYLCNSGTEDGKRVHKSSICRIMINPGFGRKSHECILCVRGYTADTKPCNLNLENLIDTDTFLVKGLDRKSTRLNSSHSGESRMPSSA